MGINRAKEKNIIPKKTMCFFWPFRESLGGNINGINFKIGELVNVLFCLNLITKPKKKITNRNFKNIILLLIMYILLLIIPSIFQINYIDKTFFVKTLAKSILCFFLIYLVITRRFSFSKNNIDVLFKWTVIVELFFFVLQYIFKKHIIDFRLVDLPGTTMMINGITRFTGSASEPGYIVPILAPCCYYFVKNYKNNKFYCFVSHVLLLLTFSAFGYLTLLVEALVIIKDSSQKQRRTIFLIGFSFIAILAIIIFSSDKISSLFMYYFNKLLSYFSFLSLDSKFNSSLEWSAADRSQNIVIALKMFIDGNPTQQLFGRGTGAYSFLQSDYGILIEGTEEAYNLYFSTLTDRGLLGLLILILLFKTILKIPANNTVSKSLKYGCSIQIIHYFFVGDMWLYFFWQEIVMLVGLSFVDKKEIRFPHITSAVRNNLCFEVNWKSLRSFK